MTEPTHYNPEGAAYIRKIEKATGLLDSRFRVPGTNFRFGLDPLLGLIPFVGDAASLAVQAALVGSMLQHGASRKVVILMSLNILIDFAIGSIPILGNIFDFVYKSNERNLRLLKRHYVEGRNQGKGTWILWVIFLAIIAVIVLIGYLLYKLLEWFVDWVQSF